MLPKNLIPDCKASIIRMAKRKERREFRKLKQAYKAAKLQLPVPPRNGITATTQWKEKHGGQYDIQFGDLRVPKNRAKYNIAIKKISSDLNIQVQSRKAADLSPEVLALKRAQDKYRQRDKAARLKCASAKSTHPRHVVTDHTDDESIIDSSGESGSDEEDDESVVVSVPSSVSTSSAAVSSVSSSSSVRSRSDRTKRKRSNDISDNSARKKTITK